MCTVGSSVISGWNDVASMFFSLAPVMSPLSRESISTPLPTADMYGARMKGMGMGPLPAKRPYVVKLPSCLP